MRTLAYIVLTLLVTACSYSGSQAHNFEEARRMMDKNPQEAFTRLNAIDVSEIHDSATMAQWALLYSEAMLANSLSAPTDTIVNIAIDYYSRNGMEAELQKARKLKGAILSSATKDSDALSRALYLQKEKEYYLFKARAERERIIFAGIIIALCAIIIITWQRKRIREKDHHAAMLMLGASELRSQLSRSNEVCSHIEQRMGNLLDTRFSLIDRLCETYYETQGTRAEKNAIVSKVKAEIEAVKADNAIFTEMEKAVNDCRGNALRQLKEAWPDIKENDYRLAVYIACRLSTPTICLLLDEKADVIYKRKSRLKSRLATKSPALVAEIFE